MGKYTDNRLVARPEADNTFWDDNTAEVKCVAYVTEFFMYKGDFTFDPNCTEKACNQ